MAEKYEQLKQKELKIIGEAPLEGASKWMPVYAVNFEYDGEKRTHHVVKKGDVVAVLAITTDGMIPLTIQPRAGAKKENSVEIIAGRVKPEVGPLKTAIDEAFEEAGVKISGKKEDIIVLPSYYADQAGVESKGHLYILKNVVITGEQHLDDGEILKYKMYPVKDVIEMVEKGIIEDANSVLTILWARLKGII